MIDMRKAKIENGVVVNLIEVDPAQIPDWCADWPDAEIPGCAPGWTLTADGTFAPPPAPPVTVDEATARINAMIDAAAVEITGTVPEVERLSWTAKEQAARAHLDGQGTDAMLHLEAIKTGETVDVLAEKIVTNAERYREAVAVMTGVRRAALSDMAADSQPGEILERVQAELAALLNPV